MLLLIIGMYSLTMTRTLLSTSPPHPPLFSSSSSSSSSSSTLSLTPSLSFGAKKLKEPGSTGQWLLRQISALTGTCGVKEAPDLRKKTLKSVEVTCNDGSPAGYYIRRSHRSGRWIVFLEGGWYCFDHISCSERFRLMRDYMSSTNWPKYRSAEFQKAVPIFNSIKKWYAKFQDEGGDFAGNGILSKDPEENPYYFDSNVVYIPYCSSDSWSGTRNKTSVMDYSFMGSLILDRIIKELLRKWMKKTKTIILAGTSAGGTGVLINIDQVADLVHTVDPNIEVRAVVDAGWFLDKDPFKAKPCRDSFTCSPVSGIQKGTKVWEPKLPENCTSQYPGEIWRCFFGHRLYPHIKTPVYIIQNLFDAAQIQVNNVFEDLTQSELTSEQWRYLLDLGEEMKQTLQNVSAVFAPGCISHEVLTKPEWHRLHIESVSLPESVHCWEASLSVNSKCQQPSTDHVILVNDMPLADAHAPSNSQLNGNRRKNGRHKWMNQQKDEKSRRRNRNSRSPRPCRHKLIDKCPWPQCNCSCSKCRWETMSQANLYFLQSLAAVMGIDPRKMTNIHLCGS